MSFPVANPNDVTDFSTRLQETSTGSDPSSTFPVPLESIEISQATRLAVASDVVPLSLRHHSDSFLQNSGFSSGQGNLPIETSEYLDDSLGLEVQFGPGWNYGHVHPVIPATLPVVRIERRPNTFSCRNHHIITNATNRDELRRMSVSSIPESFVKTDLVASAPPESHLEVVTGLLSVSEDLIRCDLDQFSTSNTVPYTEVADKHPTNDAGVQAPGNDKMIPVTVAVTEDQRFPVSRGNDRPVRHHHDEPSPANISHSATQIADEPQSIRVHGSPSNEHVLQNQVEKLTSNADNITREKSELQTKVLLLETQNRAITASLQSICGSRDEAIKELSRVKIKVRPLEQQILNLEREIQTKSRDFAAQESRLTAMQTNTDQLRRKLSEQEVDRDQKDSVISALKSKVSSIQSELEHVRHEKSRLIADKLPTHNNMGSVTAERDYLSDQLAKSKNEQRQLSDDLQRLVDERLADRLQYDNVRRENTALAQKIVELQHVAVKEKTQFLKQLERVETEQRQRETDLLRQALRTQESKRALNGESAVSEADWKKLSDLITRTDVLEVELGASRTEVQDLRDNLLNVEKARTDLIKRVVVAEKSLEERDATINFLNHRLHAAGTRTTELAERNSLLEDKLQQENMSAVEIARVNTEKAQLAHQNKIMGERLSTAEQRLKTSEEASHQVHQEMLRLIALNSAAGDSAAVLERQLAERKTAQLSVQSANESLQRQLSTVQAQLHEADKRLIQLDSTQTDLQLSQQQEAIWKEHALAWQGYSERLAVAVPSSSIETQTDENVILVFDMRIRELESICNQLNDEAASLRSQVAERDSAIEDYRISCEKLNLTVAESREASDQLQAIVQKFQSQMEHDLTVAQAIQQNQIPTLNERINQLLIENERMKELNKQAEQKNSMFGTQLPLLEERCVNLENERNSLKADLEQKVVDFNTAMSEHDREWCKFSAAQAEAAGHERTQLVTELEHLKLLLTNSELEKTNHPQTFGLFMASSVSMETQTENHLNSEEAPLTAQHRVSEVDNRCRELNEEVASLREENVKRETAFEQFRKSYEEVSAQLNESVLRYEMLRTEMLTLQQLAQDREALIVQLEDTNKELYVQNGTAYHQCEGLKRTVFTLQTDFSVLSQQNQSSIDSIRRLEQETPTQSSAIQGNADYSLTGDSQLLLLQERCLRADAERETITVDYEQKIAELTRLLSNHDQEWREFSTAQADASNQKQVQLVQELEEVKSQLVKYEAQHDSLKKLTEKTERIAAEEHQRTVELTEELHLLREKLRLNDEHLLHHKQLIGSNHQTNNENLDSSTQQQFLQERCLNLEAERCLYLALIEDHEQKIADFSKLLSDHDQEWRDFASAQAAAATDEQNQMIAELEQVKSQLVTYQAQQESLESLRLSVKESRRSVAEEQQRTAELNQELQTLRENCQRLQKAEETLLEKQLFENSQRANGEMIQLQLLQESCLGLEAERCLHLALISDHEQKIADFDKLLSDHDQEWREFSTAQDATGTQQQNQLAEELNEVKSQLAVYQAQQTSLETSLEEIHKKTASEQTVGAEKTAHLQILQQNYHESEREHAILVDDYERKIADMSAAVAQHNEEWQQFAEAQKLAADQEKQDLLAEVDELKQQIVILSRQRDIDEKQLGSFPLELELQQKSEAVNQLPAEVTTDSVEVYKEQIAALTTSLFQHDKQWREFVASQKQLTDQEIADCHDRIAEFKNRQDEMDQRYSALEVNSNHYRIQVEQELFSADKEKQLIRKELEQLKHEHDMQKKKQEEKVASFIHQEQKLRDQNVLADNERSSLRQEVVELQTQVDLLQINNSEDESLRRYEMDCWDIKAKAFESRIASLTATLRAKDESCHMLVDVQLPALQKENESLAHKIGEMSAELLEHQRAHLEDALQDMPNASDSSRWTSRVQAAKLYVADSEPGLHRSQRNPSGTQQHVPEVHSAPALQSEVDGISLGSDQFSQSPGKRVGDSKSSAVTHVDHDSATVTREAFMFEITELRESKVHLEATCHQLEKVIADGARKNVELNSYYEQNMCELKALLSNRDRELHLKSMDASSLEQENAYFRTEVADLRTQVSSSDTTRFNMSTNSGQHVLEKILQPSEAPQDVASSSFFTISGAPSIFDELFRAPAESDLMKLLSVQQKVVASQQDAVQRGEPEAQLWHQAGRDGHETVIDEQGGISELSKRNLEESVRNWEVAYAQLEQATKLTANDYAARLESTKAEFEVHVADFQKQWEAFFVEQTEMLQHENQRLRDDFASLTIELAALKSASSRLEQVAANAIGTAPSRGSSDGQEALGGAGQEENMWKTFSDAAQRNQFESEKVYDQNVAAVTADIISSLKEENGRFVLQIHQLEDTVEKLKALSPSCTMCDGLLRQLQTTDRDISVLRDQLEMLQKSREAVTGPPRIPPLQKEAVVESVPHSTSPSSVDGDVSEETSPLTEDQVQEIADLKEDRMRLQVEVLGLQEELELLRLKDQIEYSSVHLTNQDNDNHSMESISIASLKNFVASREFSPLQYYRNNQFSPDQFHSESWITDSLTTDIAGTPAVWKQHPKLTDEMVDESAQTKTDGGHDRQEVQQWINYTGQLQGELELLTSELLELRDVKENMEQQRASLASADVFFTSDRNCEPNDMVGLREISISREELLQTDVAELSARLIAAELERDSFRNLHHRIQPEACVGFSQTDEGWDSAADHLKLTIADLEKKLQAATSDFLVSSSAAQREISVLESANNDVHEELVRLRESQNVLRNVEEQNDKKVAWLESLGVQHSGKIQSLEAQLLTKENLISDLRSELQNLENQMSVVSSDSDSGKFYLKTKLDETEQKLQTAEDELRETVVRTTELQRVSVERETRIGELQADLQTYKTKLRNRDEKLHAAESTSAASQQQIFQLESVNRGLHDNITLLMEEIEVLQRKIDQLNLEIESLQAEVERKQALHDAFRARVIQEAGILDEEIAGLRDHLQTRESEFRSLEGVVESLRQEKQDLEARLKTKMRGHRNSSHSQRLDSGSDDRSGGHLLQNGENASLRSLYKKIFEATDGSQSPKPVSALKSCMSSLKSEIDDLKTQMDLHMQVVKSKSEVP